MVKSLGAIPAYQEQFRGVFGTELNADGVAKAIAACERMILSGNAPYDRFQAGDRATLSGGAGSRSRRSSATRARSRRAPCATSPAGRRIQVVAFHDRRGTPNPWLAPELNRSASPPTSEPSS
jgi:cytochrome c peroxidase